MVQNEQAVVMLRTDAGCDGFPETVQNGEQFLTGRLFGRSESQNAGSVLVFSGAGIDQLNGGVGVAFQYFRLGATVVALVIGVAQ